MRSLPAHSLHPACSHFQFSTSCTVHGAHPDSGAFDLVMALLEDESPPDPENTNLPRPRPRNTTHPTQSGPTSTQSSHSLLLSSHWPTHFSTPVEVVELPTAGSDADLITLLTADIPVVVFNPIMDPTSFVQSPLYRAVLSHPHASMTIIGIETPETRNYVQSLFASHSPRSERDSGEAGWRPGLSRCGPSIQRLPTLPDTSVGVFVCSAQESNLLTGD